MNNLTKQTRFESYLKTNPEPIQKQILEILDMPMTSRQISEKLGYKHPIAVRPRLTELKNKGKIIEDCKVYDPYTDRDVTAYRRVEQ